MLPRCDVEERRPTNAPSALHELVMLGPGFPARSDAPGRSGARVSPLPEPAVLLERSDGGLVRSDSSVSLLRFWSEVTWSDESAASSASFSLTRRVSDSLRCASSSLRVRSVLSCERIKREGCK